MNDIAVAFADLPLSAGTLEVLASRNYITPTPIQSLVIPELMKNSCDLIAQAQTGTGKTAAYALPVIETLLNAGSHKKPRAIILAPTRELAMQIAREIDLFIGSRQLKTVIVYGGQNIEIQLRALKGNCDIVVGTPGRVIDLMERGALKLDNIEFAILDEADEMLDMGFVEDIETILAATPEEKRMLMFSATVPPEARKIAERFMKNAQYIKAPVSQSEQAAPLTEQWACEVRREDKFNALKRILHAEGRIYAMIFCRTRTDVDELTLNLQKNKFRAEALHGELTQNQRTRVIEQFKSRRFDMLVATDVAARGIDVNDLTHVINYALPTDKDIYTHRIGRTGRAGKKGVAISLFTPSEGGRFAMLRKASGGKLEQRALPDAKTIIAAKKARFKDEIDALLSKVNPAYMRMAEELCDVYDPATLLAAMLDMKFHKELLQENYPPLGRGSRDHRPGSADRRNRGFDRDQARPPRRKSAPNSHTAEPTAENPEKNRKTDKKRRSERSERPGRNNNAAGAPPQEKKNFSEDKPRKRLRDWAMDITGNAPELPRYKVKKRK